MLLKKIYLLYCLVNSSALNGKKGYVGYSLVIKGIDDGGIIFHDPGLPPMENRRVDLVTFEKAWAYPNANVKNLVAIKAKN